MVVIFARSLIVLNPKMLQDTKYSKCEREEKRNTIIREVEYIEQLPTLVAKVSLHPKG